MRTTCAISSTFLVLLTTLVVSCMPARCLGSDLRFYLDAWALDSYDLSCTSDTWFLFDAMPNRV